MHPSNTRNHGLSRWKVSISLKNIFRKSIEELNHTLNAKYVLVSKKNVSVLKNSLEERKVKHNLPLYNIG